MHAVIFGAEDYNLASLLLPSAASWELFWKPGDTLVGHGSSRKEAWESGVGIYRFVVISGLDFESFSGTSKQHWCFCYHAILYVFFCSRVSGLNMSGRMELEKNKAC